MMTIISIRSTLTIKKLYQRLSTILELLGNCPNPDHVLLPNPLLNNSLTRSTKFSVSFIHLDVYNKNRHKLLALKINQLITILAKNARGAGFRINIPNIYLRNALKNPEVFLSACNIHDIFIRYAWDMADICLRYSWDMPDVCMSYAFYVS